jgi:hypothetical protein
MDVSIQYRWEADISQALLRCTQLLLLFEQDSERQGSWTHMVSASGTGGPGTVGALLLETTSDDQLRKRHWILHTDTAAHLWRRCMSLWFCMWPRSQAWRTRRLDESQRLELRQVASEPPQKVLMDLEKGYRVSDWGRLGRRHRVQ